MLRVSLTELERVGVLQLRRRIPEDDPLWRGMEPNFRAPVEVDLTLGTAGSGRIIASGVIRTSLAQECRRCLEPIDLPFEHPIELIWSAADALDQGADGEDEVRTLDPAARELELGEAIREELILSAPAFVLCREDCRGICPICGINRNEEECQCTPAEPDPRWDALRRND